MIEFKEVTYRFPDGKTALDDISLRIDEGETAALVGGNGSGKTTLILLLNGILKATSGEVSVFGLNPAIEADAAKLKSKVGIVFQNPDNQLVSTTVEREIAFSLENMNVSREEMHARVKESMAFFQLEELRDRLTSALSGGEKQKLALAAVMISRPDILVLDEPDSYLDESGKRLLDAAVSDLAEKNPKLCIIQITQYAGAAEKYPRIIALEKGKLLADGPPDTVYREVRKLYASGIDVPIRYRLERNVDYVIQIPDEVKHQTVQIRRVRLNNVGYDYGAVDGDFRLESLNYEFRPGKIYGIVGPSGSGKSTMMQICTRLLEPKKGYVDFGTEHIPAGKLAAVFQHPERQFFLETVKKELTFGPENIGLKDIDEVLQAAYHKTNLPEEVFAERNPQTLSGGEKRRLAFGTVISMVPDFIFFDEPTCGLDTRSIGHLKYMIMELKESGAGIVIISHSGDIILDLAEEVIELRSGRIAVTMETCEYFRHRDYSGFLSKPDIILFQEREFGEVRHFKFSDLRMAL